MAQTQVKESTVIDYRLVNSILDHEAKRPRGQIENLIRTIRGRRLFQNDRRIITELSSQFAPDLVFFAVKAADLLDK